MKDSKSDPFYVEDLLQRVSSQGPERAFETATYITASLIRAVLNHQTIPIGMEDEYKNACTQHSKYLKAGIIGGAILLLMGVFIGSIELILFGPILAFIIVKIGSSIHERPRWAFSPVYEKRGCVKSPNSLLIQGTAKRPGRDTIRCEL